MKLFSLEEMGTGLVVRKEIQCAFNFVWKIMFSSTLLNIVIFLPNKSSTSSYCPNALLKLRSWPLFWNLLPFVATSWLLSSEAFTSFLLSPEASITLALSPEASIAFPLSSEVAYPSRGPSSSDGSMATESHQRHESCHFSCTSVTDAVGISKQTLCFPLRKTISFTLESIASSSCSLSSS